MGQSVLVVDDSAGRRGALASALRERDIQALAVSSRDLAHLPVRAGDLAAAVVGDRLSADTPRGILSRLRRWNPRCAGVVLLSQDTTVAANGDVSQLARTRAAHDVAAYVAELVRPSG